MQETGALVHRVVDAGARSRVDAEAGARLSVYVGCDYHSRIPVGTLYLSQPAL